MHLKIKSFLKEWSGMIGLVLFMGPVSFWSRPKCDQRIEQSPWPQPAVVQALLKDWSDGSFQSAFTRDWSLPNLKVSLARLDPDIG